MGPGLARVRLVAAIIEQDGDIHPINLDRTDMLDAMYRAIGCNLVDVVGLAENLDMWLDDEGTVCPTVL